MAQNNHLEALRDRFLAVVTGVQQRDIYCRGICKAVLILAGQDVKDVVVGQLKGSYRDQDGSSTGETYPINYVCPYKVINCQGKDNYWATGWLDCLWRYLDRLKSQEKWTDEALLKEMVLQIERARPMEPIVLTEIGDKLEEYPPSPRAFGLEYLVDHTRDDKKLGSCVGVHAYCGGWVDRNRASETHDAICCRKCNLRVGFPKEITTYGELRAYLHHLQPNG